MWNLLPIFIVLTIVYGFTIPDSTLYHFYSQTKSNVAGEVNNIDDKCVAEKLNFTRNGNKIISAKEGLSSTTFASYLCSDYLGKWKTENDLNKMKRQFNQELFDCMKLRYMIYDPQSPLLDGIDRATIDTKLEECESSETVKSFNRGAQNLKNVYYSIYGYRINLCRDDTKFSSHVPLEFAIADEARPEVRSTEIDKYVKAKYEMYEKMVKCIMEPVEKM